MDDLFVIRVWAERAPKAVRWCGSVEHVASRLRHYFYDRQALMDFLERQLADLGGAPPSPTEELDRTL